MSLYGQSSRHFERLRTATCWSASRALARCRHGDPDHPQLGARSDARPESSGGPEWTFDGAGGPRADRVPGRGPQLRGRADLPCVGDSEASSLGQRGRGLDPRLTTRLKRGGDEAVRLHVLSTAAPDQCAQRIVNGLGIGELGNNVGVEQDDVGTSPIPIDILAANATREVVLGQHVLILHTALAVEASAKVTPCSARSRLAFSGSIRSSCSSRAANNLAFSDGARCHPLQRRVGQRQIHRSRQTIRRTSPSAQEGDESRVTGLPQVTHHPRGGAGFESDGTHLRPGESVEESLCPVSSENRRE